ncbi:MAG: PAS domain-containing sensor histidine kinase [Deltaproteobacteria bacterium]|nr:PAS domain-containing sensor histidine kinase [Deltaproteobacteria bacterium]
MHYIIFIAGALTGMIAVLVILRLRHRQEESDRRTDPFHSPSATAVSGLSGSLNDQALVVTLDTAWNVIDANQRFLAIFDYDFAGLAGCSYFDLLADTKERPPVDLIKSSVGDGRPWNGRLLYASRHGRTFTLDVAFAPSPAINDVVGNITAIHLRPQDQPRFEQALLESELRYRGLLDLSPDAIVVLNEGRIRYANTTSCRILGVTARHKLLGRDLLQFISPTQEGVTRERLAEIFAHCEPFGPVDARILRRSRSPIDVRLFGSAFEIDGRPGMQVIVRDVSQWTRSVRALEASEKRFRNVVQHLGDGLFLLDGHGRTSFANAAAEKMFGRSLRTLRAQPFDQLLMQSQWGTLRNVWRPRPHATARWRLWRTMGTVRTTRAFRSKSPSKRWAARRAGAFIALVRDITERKLTEEALVIAVESAEAADRAKSEFLANMSHELRTPLNAIIGFSDLIKTGYENELPERARTQLEFILKAGRHLLALINDVLDLAKMDAGRLEIHKSKFSLDEFFRDVPHYTEGIFREKEIQWVPSVPSDLGFLYGDELRLRQVVVNLLSNAAKFSEPRGRVGIEVRIDVDRLRFDIWDEGTGIPAAMLDAVFRRFVQVDASSKRRAQGTGLGLPISKQLVEMHGGTIHAESTEGLGSRFIVVLPGVDRPETLAAVDHGKSAAVAPRGE